jgi:hypothetical protein
MVATVSHTKDYGHKDEHFIAIYKNASFTINRSWLSFTKYRYSSLLNEHMIQEMKLELQYKCLSLLKPPTVFGCWIVPYDNVADQRLLQVVACTWLWQMGSLYALNSTKYWTARFIIRTAEYYGMSGHGRLTIFISIVHESRSVFVSVDGTILQTRTKVTSTAVDRCSQKSRRLR